MTNLENINALLKKVRALILDARAVVSRTVNSVVVLQNWEIGRMIVEEEQNGKSRAEYGKFIIKELAEKLTREFGSGYSYQHLMYCKQFYNEFPIRHAVSGESEKIHAVSGELQNQDYKISEALNTKSHPLFKIISPQLTWTHYRLLLKVKNPKAREFYMNEAIANAWSTRALNRQINSLYYERIISSTDKQAVINEMKEKTSRLQPEDILKDPYILEFLQLKENKKYLESDLEQALIDKMNDFLLELGKGFAFVARQKRISTETKHFYIDLVFYNYILKCFVLIDLKTGELTHQDIGQMDMYVRLYEDKYKSADDNPTIGIILCTYADETIVKYSVLNENKQLFASKYKLFLPTEEELRKELQQEREKLELKIKLDKNN